jgi:hypothetical protein
VRLYEPGRVERNQDLFVLERVEPRVSPLSISNAR